MGQITTGVGLVSGLNIADIVDQLMSIEQRPKNQIEQRNLVLKSQQTAYQEINAKLLGLKSAANSLVQESTFNATSTTTNDETVLAVSSDNSALPGSYSLLVNQLVASQQTITRGFADTDSTLMGQDTALTFESGSARLDSITDLARLNGGEGVQRGLIRITDRSGASAIVDLRAAVTVNDVLDTINQATGVNVIASATNEGFVIEDASGSAATNLTISDVGTTATASSLGIAGTSAAGTITGTNINTLGGDSALVHLNDGNGIRKSAGNDLAITDANGTYAVDISTAVTLDDVFDLIETASAGSVTGAVNADGTGIELTGAGTVTVTANETATDLGLTTDSGADGVVTGDRLIAGLNSKLLRNLNGGTGLAGTLGVVSITNSAGGGGNVDLSGANSVSDIIEAINDAGLGVTASLNQAGSGIALTDNANGAGDLVIADSTGSAATDLNLAGTFTEGLADSGNLQFQYVTEGTLLDALGVQRGKFTIRDATGASATVDLTQGNETTIGDVISEINSRGLALEARINDNGDGIIIEDTSTAGSVTIKIEEDGSSTAADLGLLGEATDVSSNFIDGSFEKTVAIAATDTLTDVARKISDANVGVSASIINDGSISAPYRLSLTSEKAGSAGAFVFDDGGLEFRANNLAEAQDAVAFLGGDDPTNSLVVTSRTNQLNDLIPGVTVDLLSTSEKAVQITVSRDTGSIVDSVRSLVDNFNGVVDSINTHDSYNSETEERGLLLGDSTVSLVQQQLYNAIIGANSELTGQFKSLSQIGITVGSGAKVRFDESKFLDAYNADEDAVTALFNFKQTEEDADGEEVTIARGVGVEIDELLQRLTDTQSGAIQLRVDSIDQQIQLNEDRIESIEELLEAKRARYEAQFVAMEQALARLQDQGSALSSLANIAAQAQSSGANG